jgi:hypothetical protein
VAADQEGNLRIPPKRSLEAITKAAWPTPCAESFDEFVTSIAAPTATGWNDSCRAGFAPAEEVFRDAR